LDSFGQLQGRIVTKKEARKILNAADAETLMGKRDRGILSVGFQAGLELR